MGAWVVDSETGSEEKEMKSATIRFSSHLFLDAVGLPYFNGSVDSVEVEKSFNNDSDGVLKIKISGDDDRLPSEKNYPACRVICKRIEAHIEKVEVIDGD